MIGNKKILGLIPARGGSKGIPRKNIRNISGIPLVGFAITAARLVPEIDMVTLSTDDQEIADVGKTFGADVPFLRPAEIAADDTPMIDVVSFTLKYLEGHGQSFDYVCLFQPTTPFRDPKTISKAIALLDSRPDADSCVALAQVIDFHPKRIRRIVDGYVEGYLGENADAECQQRQAHFGDAAYRRCGTFYISRSQTILRQKSVFGRKVLPYIVDGCQAVTIDDKLDLLLVEAIWSQRHAFPELKSLKTVFGNE